MATRSNNAPSSARVVKGETHSTQKQISTLGTWKPDTALNAACARFREHRFKIEARVIMCGVAGIPDAEMAALSRQERRLLRAVRDKPATSMTGIHNKAAVFKTAQQVEGPESNPLLASLIRDLEEIQL